MAVALAHLSAGKILARHTVQLDNFTFLPLTPPQIEVSPIGPMRGKRAFAQREADLLNTSSSVRRKQHLILRHVREISRIVRSPLEKIRV